MMTKLDNRSCNRCGDCCRGITDEKRVYLTSSDIINIHKLLNIPRDTFHNLYTSNENVKSNHFCFNLVYLNNLSGECVFLKNNSCQIQNAKPSLCRRWPEKEVLIEFKNISEYPCIKRDRASASKISDVVINEFMNELV